MSGLDLQLLTDPAEQRVRAYPPGEPVGFEMFPEISERGRDFLKELHSILETLLPDLEFGIADEGLCGQRVRSASVIAAAEPQESLV
jgi:hypothetical protein